MRRTLLLMLAVGCAGRAGPIANDDGGAPLDAGPDQSRTSAASHRYCPGYQPYPAPTVTCLRQEDCPVSTGDLCVGLHHPQQQFCPQPIAVRRECDRDQACPANFVCEIDRCGESVCKPACPAQPCGPATTCVNGRCVRKRCDEAGADPCPADWSCHPGPTTTETLGCVANGCRDGYRCPMPFDCNPSSMNADLHGCVRRTCQQSSDCACGSCVQGRCDEAPGVCGQPATPPP